MDVYPRSQALIEERVLKKDAFLISSVSSEKLVAL